MSDLTTTPTREMAVEAANRFKADWIKGWDDFMAKHPSLGMLMDVSAEQSWDRPGGSQANEMTMARYILSQSPPTESQCQEFVHRIAKYVDDHGYDPDTDPKYGELTAELMNLAGWASGPSLRNPVVHVTVRDAKDELHVECRFADGQKYAAVIIPKANDDDDSDESRLVHWIARKIIGIKPDAA